MAQIEVELVLWKRPPVSALPGRELDVEVGNLPSSCTSAGGSLVLGTIWRRWSLAPGLRLVVIMGHG